MQWLVALGDAHLYAAPALYPNPARVNRRSYCAYLLLAVVEKNRSYGAVIIPLCSEAGCAPDLRSECRSSWGCLKAACLFDALSASPPTKKYLYGCRGGSCTSQDLVEGIKRLVSGPLRSLGDQLSGLGVSGFSGNTEKWRFPHIPVGARDVFQLRDALIDQLGLFIALNPRDENVLRVLLTSSAPKGFTCD